LMVVTKLTGNEAQQQSLKLMTRDTDGAALCAMDPPTKNAGMSQRVPGAPEAVRCGMTCSSDVGCKHFNYVSTGSNPCQLYHYRPRYFGVSPHCEHYYQPGQQNDINNVNLHLKTSMQKQKRQKFTLLPRNFDMKFDVRQALECKKNSWISIGFPFVIHTLTQYILATFC